MQGKTVGCVLPGSGFDYNALFKWCGFVIPVNTD